ncbi:MAG: hypothetical protein ACFB02_21465 [Mastigocoleus sp.]
MNSEEEDMQTNGKNVPLPKPDPDNIKVLTSNLPKAPILPWNHFDSPWLEGEVNNLEGEEEGEVEVDISETEGQKKEDPDDSVITEDVQSNSSSCEQFSFNEIEEQPQNQLVKSTEEFTENNTIELQTSVDSESWFNDEF